MLEVVPSFLPLLPSRLPLRQPPMAQDNSILHAPAQQNQATEEMPPAQREMQQQRQMQQEQELRQLQQEQEHYQLLQQ